MWKPRKWKLTMTSQDRQIPVFEGTGGQSAKASPPSISVERRLVGTQKHESSLVRGQTARDWREAPRR